MSNGRHPRTRERAAAWAAMLAAVLMTTPTLVACPSPPASWGLEDQVSLRVAPGASTHVTVELNDWATIQGQSVWIQVQPTNAPRVVLDVVPDDRAADEVATTSGGGFVLSEPDLGRLCTPGVPCRIGLSVVVPATVAFLVDVRVFAGANRPAEGCGYNTTSPPFDPRAELLVVED